MENLLNMRHRTFGILQYSQKIAKAFTQYNNFRVGFLMFFKTHLKPL